MKSRTLTLATALAIGLVCRSAQADHEDDLVRDSVVVLHDEAGADGKLSIFDADLTATLVSRDSVMQFGEDFEGTGKILVQTDDDIVFAANHAGEFPDANNSDVGLRNSKHHLLQCITVCQGNGLGGRISSMVGFADDRVFFGRGRNDVIPGGVSNGVVHGADLTADFSGPKQFGDQIEGLGVPAAVVSSAGHLYLTWQNTSLDCSPDPPGSCHGRIGRQPDGNLQIDPPDPLRGLGATDGGTTPILGLHLDKLSDDTLVLAQSDREVKLFDPDTLTGGLTSGGLGTPSATISAIGVLSDDRVVVATDEGELLVRNSDLTPSSLQALFGDPLGTHEITAMGVASDDEVVVGTAGGILMRFTYDSGAGTLTQAGTELTGLGRIADIDFLNGPPPSGACNLPGSCQILAEADCLAQGGTYDGDDTECAATFNIPGDCNQDGAFDLSDVIHLLGFLFQGNPEDLPCRTLAANLLLMDCNQDGGIDLSDAVYKLAFLFQGGPPPVQGEGCTDIPECPQNQGCP